MLFSLLGVRTDCNWPGETCFGNKISIDQLHFDLRCRAVVWLIPFLTLYIEKKMHIDILRISELLKCDVSLWFTLLNENDACKNKRQKRNNSYSSALLVYCYVDFFSFRGCLEFFFSQLKNVLFLVFFDWQITGQSARHVDQQSILHMQTQIFRPTINHYLHLVH